MANELVDRGFANDAVQAFERAVEAARDRVAVSIGARWLVQRYFEEGRTDRALEVARQCAAVHSAGGLDILGQLAERMGRYDEAEGAYVAMARSYPDEAFRLSAYYIRYERRVADGRYRAQAAAAERELFPGGMKQVSVAELRTLAAGSGGPGASPVGAPMREMPTKDLQAVGLRMGDTVLAVDGYRVLNASQYSCVFWLTDRPEVSMVVWRGQFVELSGSIDRQRHGPRDAGLPKSAQASAHP